MILEKIKENKKKTVGLLVILFIVASYVFNASWVPRLQSSSEKLWAFDIDNPKELVGIHSNVFVAKVMKKKNSVKNKHNVIYTKFNVEVLKNIKGDFKGKKELIQEGGKYGIYELRPDDGGFIKEGKTYLFFTGTNKKILEDAVGHQEVIKNSEKYSEKEILNLKEVRKLIEDYQEFYKNEIYNVSKVSNNWLENSYKKFTDEERQEWLDEYWKKEKEESRKNFIEEYAKKGKKISPDELEELIEKDFSGIDMKIEKTKK